MPTDDEATEIPSFDPENFEGIDLSGLGSDGTFEPAEDNSVGDDSPKYPAHYAELLDGLPAEFHSTVAEKIKKWDQNATSMQQKVHQQYAPYKPFIERNVDPTAITTALGFADALNANPMAVFEQLKQHLTEAGMLEEAAAVAEEQREFVEDQQLQVKDPRVDQLAQQHELLMQRFQQDEQIKVQQAAEQEVDSEFEELESITGKLPDEFKREIALRAITLSNARPAGSPPVTVKEAFISLQQFMKNARRSSPNASAPKLPSGNSGTPLPQPASYSTKDERGKGIAAIIASLQQ